MSRLTTLRKQFYEQVGITLMEYGFTPRRSSQAFQRKTQYGWESVHLAFIMHPPVDFDVTVNLAVRIDAVEELTYEENPLAPKGQKSRTATFAVEFGNLTEGRQRRWRVADSSDVSPAVLSIKAEVKKVAIPYFKKYSDLDAVFDLVSSNDRKSSLLSPFHDKRCKSALALAHVMKKYEMIEKIIETSESFFFTRMKEVEPSFKPQWEHQLKSFQKFAVKIRGLTST